MVSLRIYPTFRIWQCHCPPTAFVEGRNRCRLRAYRQQQRRPFGYDIGDAVRFTSVQPYKLVVTGRVKHYISAFGEHVIGKEVEEAMHITVAKHGAEVNEFTVAPQVNPPEGGLAYHEWLIEFEKLPLDPVSFAVDLDKAMTEQNIYYKDLIDGNVLRPLVIRVLPKGSFIEYMKKQGKLGGQNKVPRLMNERKIADALQSQNSPTSQNNRNK